MKTLLALSAFLLIASLPLAAQAPAWAGLQIEAAVPTGGGLEWQAAPAVVGTTTVPATGLRIRSAVGGAWFGVLPYIRLSEPPAGSPAHASWAALALDHPWLIEHHWDPGQIPPVGPDVTTADLLIAVGLDTRVNPQDLAAIDLGPAMAAPSAIVRFVDDVLLACRHHALPVASPTTPVLFDPRHADWETDHYGEGISPAWTAWLNASKGPLFVEGTPVTGLVPPRLAEVALAYTAPDAAALGDALRRMNEIEDVGYEVWMHLIVFSPEICVIAPQEFPDDGSVPEVGADMPPASVRFGISDPIAFVGPGVLGSTIVADPKLAGTAPSGAAEVFIPVPLSSIDTLQVEIPLAAGGSTTIVSQRFPFEPGFRVLAPPTPVLHPTADWILSYPPVASWPGFPLAPMANPVASGIIP